MSVTDSGGITQANNAALVNVTGGHTGTLTFQTGTLNASNGTGLQFNNADGSYNFNATTTLNGGDAGVDIANASDGTFTVSSSTAITNPSGTSFLISNSNAAVTYHGSISDSTGFAVDIDNDDGKTLTFDAGNITQNGVASGIRANSTSVQFPQSNHRAHPGVRRRGRRDAASNTGGTTTSRPPQVNTPTSRRHQASAAPPAAAP